jgi:hypothetical protein
MSGPQLLIVTGDTLPAAAAGQIDRRTTPGDPVMTMKTLRAIAPILRPEKRVSSYINRLAG